MHATHSTHKRADAQTRTRTHHPPYTMKLGVTCRYFVIIFGLGNIKGYMRPWVPFMIENMRPCVPFMIENMRPCVPFTIENMRPCVPFMIENMRPCVPFMIENISPFSLLSRKSNLMPWIVLRNIRMYERIAIENITIVCHTSSMEHAIYVHIKAILESIIVLYYPFKSKYH